MYIKKENPFGRNVIFLTQGIFNPFMVGFNDNTHDIKFWEQRTCGLVSTNMLIATRNKEIPLYRTSLEEGLSLGAYIPGVGWHHKGLVERLNENNIHAQSNTNENMSELIAALKDGQVCIASVSSGFNPNKKGGHLIVAQGIYTAPNGQEGVLVHHPHYKKELNWVNRPIPTRIFAQSFSGNFISAQIN